MGLRDFLKGIADAIRSKTGKSDAIPASDFASEINNVYDAGKQAEYDRFWDELQKDPYNRIGYRYDYRYAFMGQSGWNDKIYNPKYDFGIPKTVTENGVTKDVRRVTYAQEMFLQTQITDTLKPMDFTEVYKTTSGVFSHSQLKTIRTLTVIETTTFNRWFDNMEKLENITFEGVIGENIDFQWSTKLSKDSITNIIEHLSTTASGKTLTLSKTAVNTAFNMTDENPSAEWSALISTKQNWAFSLI